MKSGRFFFKLTCSWTGLVMALLILSTSVGAGDDNKCYLEAAFEDVLVAVWIADAGDNT